MLPFLAQTEHLTLRFARLGMLSEWWHWLLFAAVIGGVAWYVAWMYRRDSVELSRSLAAVLTLLRLVAFAGILFYYFKLEVRTEREIVKNSRAIVVVDTSQSMGLRDTSAAAGTGLRRIDSVIAALKNLDLIKKLCDAHDVVVYRFDQEEKPVEIASLPKTADPNAVRTPQSVTESAIEMARQLAAIGAGLVAAGLLAGIVHLSLRKPGARPEDRTAWALLVSMVALIAGVIVLATASLVNPQLPLETIAGLSNELPREEKSKDEQPELVAEVDWETQFTPRGIETRLGDALKNILAGERGGTAAGIVVMTDGNNNAGSDLSAAIAVARDAAIPIYTVGLGSDVLPLNVRIVDVEAPQRAYLGDKFTVSGHVMLTGVQKSAVALELLSRPAPTGDETDIGAAGQGDTDRSGIYEAWTTTLQGQPDVRRWTLNVDPNEGNLAAADPAEVTQQLSPAKIGWQKSENVSYLAARQAGYNRSLLVMVVLLALMFGEQALAYSASYHVARPSAR